jgi:hypothetical protein
MPRLKSKAQRPVEHDRGVIDALGGATKVARLCQVLPQAVSQWRKEGIPDARRQYLKLLRPDLFVAEGSKSEAAPERRIEDRRKRSMQIVMDPDQRSGIDRRWR